MKKVICFKDTGVVVHISDTAEMAENGIDVGGMIYAQVDELEILEVASVPVNVKPQAFKLIDGVFTANENYIPYVDPQQEIVRLRALLDDATTLLIEGGIL